MPQLYLADAGYPECFITGKKNTMAIMQGIGLPRDLTLDLGLKLPMCAF